MGGGGLMTVEEVRQTAGKRKAKGRQAESFQKYKQFLSHRDPGAKNVVV